MRKIKCLVCSGKHFRKGYYEVNTDIDIHSIAYNSTTTYNIPSSFTIAEPIEVDTTIHNETITSSNIDFRLVSEERNRFSHSDNQVFVYKYICEDCGYIMSFTKEVKVISKKEENEQKQKVSGYDWTEFGKEKE
ncbi:hypothetical protein ACFQ3N_03065 [Virgibacillus byunsanensis]|uniref:Uncharacterized protein n=1 Tax=Virgibacillus byunsanensis TaxID=570945 RepID=A0ABW3LJD8_9BACI